MATFSTPKENVPEQLYHTVVQCFDPTTPESPQLVFPLATHTTLATAKDFARNALQSLGYSCDDFQILDIRTPDTRDWKHGDGVLAWARAPNHWEISVYLDTKPNAERLPATDDGTDQVALPGKDLQLHYVIQTTINLNKDETRMQHSEIEGVFVHRAAALQAARRQLAALSENGEFAQYESRKSLEPCTDWPYGEDVVVHAVSHTGENYYITVATLLDSKAHNRHHRKRGSMGFDRMACQVTDKRGGVAT
ncbi:hypothetical protein PG999_009902 [Apiospora kogelbergensis]|uniref:Uncharacterized protein n=1 Tax=Apiospora kogelbergensis TaxID=1337665 RepID=A0AAW0QPR4_9PEZI